MQIFVVCTNNERFFNLSVKSFRQPRSYSAGPLPSPLSSVAESNNSSSSSGYNTVASNSNSGGNGGGGGSSTSASAAARYH